MRVSGPAAGHAWLQTAADPTGRTVLGTLNNCANGYTPWGTYLTCEENFNGYFVNRSGAVPALQKRYGINERGFGYRWHEHDARFDAAAAPQRAEPLRLGGGGGPLRSARPPVKHTALGRFKHEGATLALARDRRVVLYMGDDERFEYIYKFVSRDPWDPPRAGRRACGCWSRGRSGSRASTPMAAASGSSSPTARTASTPPPGSRRRPRS